MKITSATNASSDSLSTAKTDKVSVADLEMSVSDSLSSQLDFSARPIRHIRRAD
jgi:hypothetical protein